jgi:hypothetical protein
MPALQENETAYGEAILDPVFKGIYVLPRAIRRPADALYYAPTLLNTWAGPAFT